MNTRWGVWLLVLVACSAISCKSLKTGAKEEFSKKYSCPEDRVTVRERPDIDPSPYGKATPPTDIASDPERLALWKKQQEERAEAWRKNYEVFELEGCGQKVVLSCTYPSQRGHAGRVMCSAVK